MTVVAQQDTVSVLVSVLQSLNSVGTLGLALVVVVLYKIIVAIQKGEWVTKREYDREIDRCSKLESRLDRALQIGDRLIDAGDKLAEKLPGKS